MPVYNSARYLREAVQSILDQTFAEFDLILVDGGSTDDSMSIADEFARADPRVRIGPRTCRNLAAARNELVSLAKGELLVWLDADDVAMPDRLERQVAYMAAHPECVALGTSAQWITSDGQPIRVQIQPLTHEEIDGHHLLGTGGGIYNPTSMIRRDALLAVGGYRSHFCEDYDVWLRLAEVGRLANLPDVLLKYRLHASQTTHTRAEQNSLAEMAALSAAKLRRAGGKDSIDGLVTRETLRRMGWTNELIDRELGVRYIERLQGLERQGRHEQVREELAALVNQATPRDRLRWVSQVLWKFGESTFWHGDADAGMRLLTAACRRDPHRWPRLAALLAYRVSTMAGALRHGLAGTSSSTLNDAIAQKAH